MSRELVIRYPGLGTEQRVLTTGIFGMPTGQEWTVKDEEGSSTSYHRVKLIDARDVDSTPSGTLMYVVLDDGPNQG